VQFQQAKPVTPGFGGLSVIVEAPVTPHGFSQRYLSPLGIIPSLPHDIFSLFSHAMPVPTLPCLHLSLTKCTASLAAQSPCALAFRTFAPHDQYVAVARARTRPSRVQDMKISASKTNGVTSSTPNLQMRACDLARGRSWWMPTFPDQVAG
jgi:hypothetical protein